MATENGRICLDIRVHLHTPDLDHFDEAAWERTFKTKLQEFVGTDVVEISVIDIEGRIKQLVAFLQDEEVSPMIIEVLELESIFGGLDVRAD